MYKPRVFEPIARLIEYRGDTPGPVHELELGSHVLGRGAGVDIFLDHADVSRQHAELLISAEGATVSDLGSKNGVQVDGLKVRAAAIEDGAGFMLGELRLVLEHPGARVEQVLVRGGEPTVRGGSTRAQVPAPVARGSKLSLRRRNLALFLVPCFAALVFTLLLVLLLVQG